MTQSLLPIFDFLQTGGPALWAIAALSVLGLALVLWKIAQFSRLGVWASARAERAVADVTTGQTPVFQGGGIRLRFVQDCTQVLDMAHLGASEQREDITRRAMRHLAVLRRGLRALDLIAVIAPLIGLLGTVLGMIEAFQVLQQSGANADAAALAGGIWEALLTTAAGMAVAIPATIAHSWFEGVVDRMAQDFEDIATRLLLAQIK
jgi:biopolymer transport protein ExbB